MNDENQLPKDIWDEIDPVEESSRLVTGAVAKPQNNVEAVNNTVVEPAYAPNADQAQVLGSTGTQKPKQTNRGIGWWLSGVAILLLAGWYGWVTISTKTPPEDSLATTTQQDEIEWQTKVRTANLRLLADPTDRRAVETKYWKVGRFIEGKYAESDLIDMEAISSTSPSASRVVYRFVLSDGQITLLAKESPDSYVQDGLDTDAFSIDSNYTIPQLHLPDRLKLAGHSDQELLLQESKTLIWFEEKDDLVVAGIDPEWGEIYKEVATLNILIMPEGYVGLDAHAPTGGLYLKSMDGTIHTYQLQVPFITSDKKADIVWNDGSRNSGKYESHQRTVCGVFQNYTAVMPELLATELTEAGKANIAGHQESIWELTDKNHRLLTDAYELAKKDSLQPPTSYEQFLSTHPLIFWEDGLGRIIKLQNTSSLPASGCQEI